MEVSDPNLKAVDNFVRYAAMNNKMHAPDKRLIIVRMDFAHFEVMNLHCKLASIKL